jgi:hypothetical protein
MWWEESRDAGQLRRHMRRCNLARGGEGWRRDKNVSFFFFVLTVSLCVSIETYSMNERRWRLIKSSSKCLKKGREVVPVRIGRRGLRARG